jgi:agmatinase
VRMTASASPIGAPCSVDDLQAHIRPGQWCVLGVPVCYDHGDATRGAMGPALIRKSLPFLWPGFPRLLWDWTSGRAVESITSLPLDLGDIPYSRRFDRACDIEARITDAVAHIAGLGGRPLMLGGEHWITYPALRGLTEHVGPVHVVHFDAHSDTYRGSVPPEPQPPLLNSTVMTFVGSLDGVIGVLQIGIREYDVAVDLSRLGPAAKVTVIPAEAITSGPCDVWSVIPEGAKVYVTIDADVLDPAYAPEVGWPVPGGLTVIQLVRLLLDLRRRAEIVGFDLVEVLGGERQEINRAALAMARCCLALVLEEVDGPHGA